MNQIYKNGILTNYKPFQTQKEPIDKYFTRLLVIIALVEAVIGFLLVLRAI